MALTSLTFGVSRTGRRLSYRPNQQLGPSACP